MKPANRIREKIHKILESWDCLCLHAVGIDNYIDGILFMEVTNQKFPSFHFRKEMASRLATLVISKNSALTTFPNPVEIGVGDEITIGRSSSCNLVLSDVRSISHVHCRVRNTSDGVEIKCVSSNETLVDGNPIPHDQWVPLHDGASITLSKHPKVKLDLKIGDMSKSAEKKRRAEAKKRTNAIAEISSSSPENPIKYFVVSSDPHMSGENIALTIGRSKECNIRLSHSKISSVHCKLTFSRVEGESVHWSLAVENVSRNKTYVGTVSVEEETPFRIDCFTDPISIHLVFPPHKNPVDTLVVTPLIISSVPESVESTPEEKKQKKEVRALEKQSQQWQKTYSEEVKKLIELENRLLSEIDTIEISIVSKKSDIEKTKAELEKMENDMAKKDEEFGNQMSLLKDEHAKKLAQLTDSVNSVMARLAQRADEKLKLQLAASASVAAKADDSDD